MAVLPVEVWIYGVQAVPRRSTPPYRQHVLAPPHVLVANREQLKWRCYQNLPSPLQGTHAASCSSGYISQGCVLPYRLSFCPRIFSCRWHRSPRQAKHSYDITHKLYSGRTTVVITYLRLPFYFVLFYFILFYFILFYSILFYFILLWGICWCCCWLIKYLSSFIFARVAT